MLMSRIPEQRAGSKPIYLRGSAKVIGHVADGVFVKHLDGRRHFLRNPAAICFDVTTLDDAEAAGASSVAITDIATGACYRQKIAAIREHGFHVTRGFGRQIALKLHNFSIDGRPSALRVPQPTTNEERKAMQTSLFGGAE